MLDFGLRLGLGLQLGLERTFYFLCFAAQFELLLFHVVLLLEMLLSFILIHAV